MARKSRIGLQEKGTAQAQKDYKVALYIRLSVLDGGEKGNDTAETQEAVLRGFMEGKPYFVQVSVYVDNGETGTDFRRDEFKRLIEDVKSGKVDCIIVKDLSRFGRNYIETGEYLEKIFPFLGVRFIAVNDHYDSIDPSSSDSLTMHLKNLVNDVYAKDISRKICPVLRAKQERGEYIGNWAPYGYLKSPENKHKLIVDLETAPVVRQIFQYRLDGLGYEDIAKRLRESGTPTVGRYRFEKGMTKSKRLENTVWHGDAIKKILCSQVYIGHMAQGKVRSALWSGQRKIAMPKEEWVIVRNTHEAIIDEETFTAVQESNRKVWEERNSRKSHPVPEGATDNILKGIAVCGNCGKSLIWYKKCRENKHTVPRIRVRYTYICRTHRNMKESCPFIGIPEPELIAAVYGAIRIQISLAANMKELMQKVAWHEQISVWENSYMQQEKQVKSEIERICRHRETLYDDYLDGLLSERDYLFAQERYKEKEKALRQQMVEIELQTSRLPESRPEQNLWINSFLGFQDASCITREMVAGLVQSVAVHNRSTITVNFRFEDELHKLKENIASVMGVQADG